METAKRICAPKDLYELVRREGESEGKPVEDLVSEIVVEYVKEERK